MIKYVLIYLLIITKKDITKKNTGIDIANIEKIPYENIFCIGDHYNDLEMLDYFNGYTMRNSEEVLKEVSLGVYDHVSELIDDIILNKVYIKKRGWKYVCRWSRDKSRSR